MNEVSSFDPEFDPRRTKRRRDLALVVYLASGSVFGVLDLILYYHDTWSSISWVLNTLVGIVAIVAWCAYDARLKGMTISLGLRLAIWLIALVGVPVYLVRSRGWGGAARLGFGLPVFLLGLGLYYAGWYTASWVAEASGYYSG